MNSTKAVQPKPDYCKYRDLISDISKGYTQIPKFQRDFVWEKKKSAELIDSILKGYPIGTFILWKTRERLNNVKRLGNQDLSKVPDDDFVKYILDGQQRIASLFVIVEGLTIDKDGRKENYKNIYIDLEAQYDSENIVKVDEPMGRHITVHALLNEKISDLANEYKGYLEKIDAYQDALRNYDFSTILISEYPMEKAVEVFNRINTTGKPLTLFEIMVAKTYDDQSFDLREKYDSLHEDLSNVTYEIPPSQILQCISVNVTGECKRKTILGLSSTQIIDAWDKTVDAINKTVDHLRTSFAIPASRLLPYPALLVPFSYFFFKNGKSPTSQQDVYLREYFWRTALTSRFTSSVESKLAVDCKLMETIISGQRPQYGKEFNVAIKKEDIRSLQFHVGESINNAILCVMAAAGPRSFKNGSSIILNNSRLHASNSKNYHHFFPKAFLKRQKVENSKLNLISNITLVEDCVNKEIKDNPPSVYMQKFNQPSYDLDGIMKTHLIDDLAKYGVWTDDYEAFIDARTDRIWTELVARFDPSGLGA